MRNYVPVTREKSHFLSNLPVPLNTPCKEGLFPTQLCLASKSTCEQMASHSYSIPLSLWMSFFYIIFWLSNPFRSYFYSLIYQILHNSDPSLFVSTLNVLSTLSLVPPPAFCLLLFLPSSAVMQHCFIKTSPFCSLPLLQTPGSKSHFRLGIPTLCFVIWTSRNYLHSDV